MNNLKSILGFCFLSVFALMTLTACDPPKIDTSSDESVKTSIAKIKDSLDAEKKEKLEDALSVVAMAGMDEAFKDAAKGGLAGLANIDPDKVYSAAMKTLNGKTADEVIAYADKIVAERKAQALAEIKELSEKKAKADVSAKEIEKFQIIKSRFYIERQAFINQPVFDLKVKNGTSQPVSHAFCRGILSSPGRSIPWHQDDFNFSISGGMEVGEETSLKLSPNIFSGWGKVEAPTDAVFTVTCNRLLGAGDKEIYNAEFSDTDSKRLIALMEKFPS